MRYIIYFSLLIFIGFCNAQTDIWEKANAKIIRINANRFSKLPIQIIKYLNNNGYLIPQANMKRESIHNVISGEFISENKKDWAVLASKDYNSRILVFIEGKITENKIVELALHEDEGYLQTIGDNKIGYSRCLSVVDNTKLRKYYKLKDEKSKIVFSHQGFESSYYGKGSIVYFFKKGKWISFQGAD